MLPSSLLVARRSRDKIMPVYAELTSTNTEVAGLLIDLYSKHVGEKKGSMGQDLSELENVGYDYRFIRGLAVLLDRRCRLKARTIVNPLEIRRRLFQLASDKGVPTTEEERSAMILLVAKELKTGVEELDALLYGDLDDEMIVVAFDPTDPVDLLKQYNLSLTQTLLFGASELSFTASSNWQQIFRQIKWLGLIYTIDFNDTAYWVKVDGPTSLFKLTKRYGSSLAKLLPAIFSSASWKISAKVLGRMDNRRLFDLELDSLRHGRYMKQVVDEESYDSSVEEDFATQFKIYSKGWELIREPGPLPVGRYVMIPDFLLRKNKLEVYLEIVGFWTPEYLEDKVKKLSMVRDVDMIVAADRHLACEKLSKKNDRFNLILYERKIPLQPILAHLEDKEKGLVENESRILRGKELSLTAPVVDAQDIADMYNVSSEAVAKTFEQLQAAGYRRLSYIFIRETLLDTIDKMLRHEMENRKLSLAKATELIESVGGRNASEVLEALGYRIIWNGISPKLAEIRKNDNMVSS
ncbi:MAG: DUF790 family protein [Candidatus Bathyarchaeota archaeon]